MSYDEFDAAADEYYSHLYEEIGPEWARDHADEIIEEHYDETTRRFAEERLKSYYLQHPDVARPAVSAVEYAKTLLPGFATASVVFAATSVELTWKTAVLKPLVSGLVHVDALAASIVERAIPKTGGLTQLHALLSEVLRETAGIDFSEYKRSGSHVLLRQEINEVSSARNQVLHSGKGYDQAFAEFAINVAENLLVEFLPKLLDSIGLRLDGTCVVHDKDASPESLLRSLVESEPKWPNDYIGTASKKNDP